MKLKTFIFCCGMGGLMGSTITFMFTFFIAYFNGYEVLVKINDYGEAHIEMVVFLLLIPCMIYAYIESAKR